MARNKGSMNERTISEPKADWKPKTDLGRRVKAKQITHIDEILDAGMPILESEIVDELLTTEADLLLIGQSRGKFGGGQRRIFKQTQKKTMEGNKPKFSTLAVVGDKNGHVGIGLGKARETVPAREKAMRNAKLAVFKIRRGNGAWEDDTTDPHTIPFRVEGKCGSVRLVLMPAPKGKGLVAEKECQKVLKLAGIENVWSKSYGQTKNKINTIYALVDALKKLSSTKLRPEHIVRLSVIDGAKKESHGTTEA